MFRASVLLAVLWFYATVVGPKNDVITTYIVGAIGLKDDATTYIVGVIIVLVGWTLRFIITGRT